MSIQPNQQTSRISPEAFSGLLLLASAALALVAANGPWSKLYDGLLGTPLSVAVGTLAVATGLGKRPEGASWLQVSKVKRPAHPIFRSRRTTEGT